MQPLSDALASFWQIWSPMLILDVGRYLVAACGLALILKLFWNAGLSRRKIQARWASRSDVRREIVTSLRTGVIFSLNGAAIVYGAMNGIFTIYTDFDKAGVGYLVLSVVAIIVAHDAYFYWTHRLMHLPRLYPYFHRTHHRSVAPTPFAAYAFDIPEAFLMAAFTPLWLLFVPMHGLGLFLFMAFMIVRNVMGHAGVELMPRALADSRWFGWINATTHHDLHHATFHHNYGLYFTWWDRMMGTEHPRYREQLRGRPADGAAVAADSAARSAAVAS
ncbi:sterol desaturase family protein [Bradyrhizobium sp.]|uniref:sterol desaturase family protein n=1 Tax=Bradyrhizobium sp. TaxID=376 RepID=UPI003C63549A